MSKLVRAIGLMSGTSMDGIDVALLDTNGQAEIRHGPVASYAYPARLKVRLRTALAEARELSERGARPGSLGEVERELTILNAQAVGRFLRSNGIASSEIELIGYHGQTVLHDSGRGLTVQLGDGRLLAEYTGTNVVYDLRAADLARGGQGAPLTPVYHRALAIQRKDLPAAFLNIGGVANVTWVGVRLLAFDAGPGNALVDDWMLKHTGTAQDAGGAVAARGRVNQAALQELLSDRYFRVPPPKSLDRNAFSAEPVARLSLEDGAATLCAFTAASIAKARTHMPQEPKIWIVCGGGRKNKTLMTMIAAGVQNALVPVEAVGLNGDFIEAEAWAYLAVRSSLGLPITYPETTGVSEPLTSGVFAKAPH
jgi:anhydro-N-acetylmuramic acid kinase